MKKAEWYDRMLALEGEGLSRAAIAKQLNVTPSFVTQTLGAKKKYNRKPKNDPVSQSA